MPPGALDRVERKLLLHLLNNHGQQVRFEASQAVTEFGIVRQFSDEGAEVVRRGLKTLEMGRLVYRRTQYVVGYSEPKPVYFLTPSGHRTALEVQESSPSTEAIAVPTPSPTAPTAQQTHTVESKSPVEPSGSTEPTV